jgi:hypothetical protein
MVWWSPARIPRGGTAGDPPAAAYRTSVLTSGSEPEGPAWTHLRASAASLHSQELSQLLRLIADDEAAGVIIIIIITTTAAAGMRWLCHPYGGGAGVIAANTGHRDQLRRAHKDWLSVHPAGL